MIGVEVFVEGGGGIRIKVNIIESYFEHQPSTNVTL